MEGGSERGRELPSTDEGSVSFINSLVLCSAAQLIQPVNSCLSHFIGATSQRPVSPDNPVNQRRFLVGGGEEGKENKKKE